MAASSAAPLARYSAAPLARHQDTARRAAQDVAAAPSAYEAFRRTHLYFAHKAAAARLARASNADKLRNRDLKWQKRLSRCLQPFLGPPAPAPVPVPVLAPAPAAAAAAAYDGLVRDRVAGFSLRSQDTFEGQVAQAFRAWQQQIATAAAARGDHQAAAEAYGVAARTAPEDPEPLTLRAGELAAAGDIGAAFDTYREALRTRPGYVAAHAGLRALVASSRVQEPSRAPVAAVAEAQTLGLDTADDVIARGHFAGYTMLVGADADLPVGTFGRVRLAVDDTTGARVALKFIDKLAHPDADDPAQVQRVVRREAMTHAMMDHPNIIRLLRGIDRATFYCLVMEQGGPDLVTCLNADVARHGRWLGMGRERLARILGIIVQVADALAAMHARGLVHRDVKPENILIAADAATPKLIDFGFSNRQAVGERAYTRCGSVPYSAPEIHDRGGYDGRLADVFSLGCTWHEMLFGRPPFTRNAADVPAPLERLQAIYAGAVVSEATADDGRQRAILTYGLDPGVALLLTAMLRADPQQRPSMSVVLAALRLLQRTPGGASVALVAAALLPERAHAPRAAWI